MNDQRQESHELEHGDDAIIGAAFRWSLALLLIVAAAGGGIAWWLTRPAPAAATSDRELTLPTTREAPNVVVPAIPFRDVTDEAGLDFVHENGAYGDKLLPETMGGGCAFFDYDNDGDQDILLVNSRRWPWDKRATDAPATLALYKNDGGGRYENVSRGSGLDVSIYGMGAAVADYDGDGWVDLFVSAVGKGRLFRNLSGGKFADVTDEAGVVGTDSDWGTSGGWFDSDYDGDLDLFVCNYLTWSKEYDLAQNFQLIGGGRAYGRPQQFGGTFSYLYRNNGDGTFNEIGETAGIRVVNRDTGVPVGKALGVAFADFDRDGRLDVVVANDTVQNFLFHNQGDGKFREIGHMAGVAYDINGLARGAMGIDIADFRNNDSLGIAIANFANEMSALYVSQRNPLLFKDEAVSNGFGPATRLELKFGLVFFDADLDGRPDLMQANGHLEEDINKVQATQHYEQPPQMFWNCGPEHKTEFLKLSAEKCGGDFVAPMVGRGAAYADIDGDGDLDLLLTASGGRPRLLRNDLQRGHHWLRIKLVGQPPNRDAIGASVELHAAGQIQRRLVSPTRSYLSQCELPVTFGLGNAVEIEKVVVRWPSGQTEEHTGLAIDKLHTLHEAAP
jgi:hypothetical protein